MHLLSITNLDYGMMTALFCVLLGITYLFRRSNPHSADFLIMNRHSLPAVWNFVSLASVGTLEFIALSSYGAYAGIPAVCILIPVFIVLACLFEYRVVNSGLVKSIQTGTDANRHTKFLIWAYAIFMLLVAGVAISIIVTLLKSLLGWEFGNSTLSLLGVISVCLILGGVIALVYNQVVAALISTLMLIGVMARAWHQLPDGLLARLHQTALANNLAVNTFSSLQLNPLPFSQIWLVIVACIGLLLINPLYLIKRFKQSHGQTKLALGSRLGQLSIMLVMLALGIMALATPGKQTIMAGKKIVTQQTRLSDGSIGYVVKAIPTTDKVVERGIIPQQMANSNEIASIDSGQNIFDYLSSAQVMIKQVFPYAFVSLFVLILLFYKTISECIGFATIILIRGLYAPRYNKSGDDLENLWAARVCIFMLIAIAIALGLVFYKYFDLYYIFSLILLLGLPLACNLLGLSRHWVIDLLAYIGLGIWVLELEAPNVPSLLPIFKYPNLLSVVLCLSISVVGYYVLTFISGWLLPSRAVRKAAVK